MKITARPLAHRRQDDRRYLHCAQVFRTSQSVCLADALENDTVEYRETSPIFASAPWIGIEAKPEMNPNLITIDPDLHSGTPVFAGTRVPIRTLFDHLEAGDPLEVFLDDFPSVSRELAVAVLEQAKASLLTDAHPA